MRRNGRIYNITNILSFLRLYSCLLLCRIFKIELSIMWSVASAFLIDRHRAI